MTEWSKHVHRFSKKHNMSYKQANASRKCKEAYKKRKTSPRKKRRTSPRRKASSRRMNIVTGEEEIRRQLDTDRRRVERQQDTFANRVRNFFSRETPSEEELRLSRIREARTRFQQKELREKHIKTKEFSRFNKEAKASGLYKDLAKARSGLARQALINNWSIENVHKLNKNLPKYTDFSANEVFRIRKEAYNDFIESLEEFHSTD